MEYQRTKRGINQLDEGEERVDSPTKLKMMMKTSSFGTYIHSSFNLHSPLFLQLFHFHSVDVVSNVG
jgi:hypothetical protein